MANIFNMLLAGLAGQQPDAPTDVAELVVTPTKKMMPVQPPPPPPTQNPYSQDYVLAAQQADQAQRQLPRISGGTDAGLFGFLPERMQKGRIRDIFGAIGDGLLIEGGHNPIYAPRKEARQMGQALIGYDQNPNAALERLANTGAPGSIDAARYLMNGLQTAEQRQQAAEMRNDQQKTLNSLRLDSNIQNMGRNIVPGILGNVKSPKQYQAAYDRLDMMVKRLDPDANPMTAWGLPDPLDWSPEATSLFATTGGQQLQAQTSTANNVRTTQTSAANNARTTATSRANNANTTATSRRNTDVRAAATAAKPGGSSGLTPKKPGAGATKPAAAAPATGAIKPTREMISAYQGGTPAQRIKARAAWRAQGYDVRNLK